MAIKGLFNRGVYIGNTTTKVTEEDLVIYDVRTKVIKTGNTVYDFVQEEEVYEKERKNLDAFIQSFSEDVGLENILKKVALTGDQSLLNVSQAQYGDSREMPQNNQELDEKIAAAKKVAADLGFEFSVDGLNSYIKKQVEAALAAKAKEGGAE